MISKAYYFSVLLVVISSLAIAYLIKPGQREHALISLKDKSYSDSFDRYYDLWKKGEKDSNIAIPLVSLLLEYGRIKEAIAIAEEYIEVNGSSVEIVKLLGKLYLYNQEASGYLKSLVELQNMSPNTERLRELSIIYSDYEIYDKQLLVTEKIILSPNVQKSDFFDLISMYLIDGQYDKVGKTINQLVKKKYSLSNDEILLLLEASFHNDFDSESDIIADMYKNNEDFSLVLKMALMFVEHDRSKTALILIDKYKPDYKGNSDNLIVYIDVLTKSGQDKRAYETLKNMHYKSSLSESVINKTLELILKLKDYELAVNILKKYDANLIDENLLFEILSQSIADKDYNIAKFIISKELNYFENSDALYLLALSAVDSKKAQTVITNIDHEVLMDKGDKEKLRFAEIAKEIVDKKFLFKMVKGISLESLNEREIVRLSFIFIKTNHENYALKIYNKFINENSLQENVFLQTSLFLLSIAENKIALIKPLLERNKIPVEYLSDGYYIALGKGYFDMAVAISQNLYKKKDSSINRQLLAEAYLLNKDYLNSLRHYKKLQKTKRAGSDIGYLHSLLGLNDGDEYQKKFREFMDNKFSSLNLNSKLEILSLFQEFSIHKKEKSYFSNIIPDLNSKTDKLKVLKSFLASDFIDLSEELYANLAKDGLNQDSAKVILRRLGFASYYSSNYDKAKNYFDDYFNFSESDYEALYIYAKLMEINSKKKMTKVFYRKSLAILEKNQSLSQKEKMFKGRILFGLNRVKEAIKLYNNLLENNPSNQEIRIEFAHYLIDVGEVSLAQKIISRK